MNNIQLERLARERRKTMRFERKANKGQMSETTAKILFGGIAIAFTLCVLSLVLPPLLFSGMVFFRALFSL